MLPGPNCCRCANKRLVAFHECYHHIDDKPVCGPISAADYVSSAGCRDHGGFLSFREKGLPISRRDQLGGSFATGIGIVAAQLITFDVATSNTGILIAFIGRYGENR